MYDCHTFWIFFDFSIGVLNVERRILFFCDVISLLAQVFIVSFDRAYKEVFMKKKILAGHTHRHTHTDTQTYRQTG